MTDLSLKNWTAPGADEFMDQPESPDVLAEWADHDAARNAPRHPDQPTYSAPLADEAVAERLTNGNN
jgi:hypothetical protein